MATCDVICLRKENTFAELHVTLHAMTKQVTRKEVV